MIPRTQEQVRVRAIDVRTDYALERHELGVRLSNARWHPSPSPFEGMVICVDEHCARPFRPKGSEAYCSTNCLNLALVSGIRTCDQGYCTARFPHGGCSTTIPGSAMNAEKDCGECEYQRNTDG